VLPTALLLLCLAPAQGEVVDRIAAVVEKDVITLSEVYALGGEFIESAAQGRGMDDPARRTAELEVLEELVQRALVAREIEDLGLLVTADEIDRAIDDIAQSNDVDRARLKVEVERSGLEWGNYRHELEQELRKLKFDQVVIQPRISISEDEVLDVYNRNVRSAEGPTRRTIQSILLRETVGPEAVERLEAARARLADSETWAAVVAEFPESPYASLGGEMGVFLAGELMEPLDGPAFSLGVGGVSDLIVVPGVGTFLLRVDSVISAEPPSLESVRGELEGRLVQDKVAQETQIWLAQARRRVTVDIKLAP
jgi:peptidyl-prolyl cis-trans isomerase SurA